MDKINQYKRTKFEEETSTEFYLNPKDISINDKVCDSSNLISILSYLKYNELLILLLEQSIVIIDIKKSISTNLTIIKYLNINDLYNDIFPQNKKYKEKKLILGSNFSCFCFRNKEYELKSVKNFKCFDNKKQLNKIYLMIEFYNLDFAIISYDNVQMNFKYKIIYQHQKDFWSQNKNLKMNYDINLIYNYYTYIKILQDDDKTFIFYLCENYIYYFELDFITDSFLLKKKIKIENEIKFFDLKKMNNSNKYILITINYSNIIKGNIIDFHYEKILKSENLNKENEGLISFFSIENSKFIYSQFNIIYIYNIVEKNSVEYKLIKKITFSQFEDYNIKYVFLSRNDLIFIFNNNGDYSIQDLNSENNLKEINNNKIYSLSILKIIYDMKEFESKIGFLMVGTQNPIKNSNLNLIYFIPQELSNIIIKERDNFFYNNYSQNNFYTEQLCEKIIFQIRFPDNKEKETEEKNINKKRVLYYIYSLFSEKQNEIINIKNDIINLFREKNKIKREHILYLNNENYLCEFCNEKFVSFTKKSYQCLNNHETFICCITYLPLNENFNQCQKCNLFYSPECKNEKICLICQQMLKPI